MKISLTVFSTLIWCATMPLLQGQPLLGGYVVAWDPVGSLSGSWYEESYNEWDIDAHERNSPWLTYEYDMGEVTGYWGRPPQPGPWWDVVFPRTGTYTLTLEGGAELREAKDVHVQAGNVTLNLTDNLNKWNGLYLGTNQQAASLTLSGNGALRLVGGLHIVQNGLLSLEQTASLDVWNRLVVAEDGGLQMRGGSGLFVDWQLTIDGLAVVEDSAQIRVPVLSVAGSMLLQDSAQILAQTIDVSGHLRVEDNATLNDAIPEWWTNQSTGVREGGLLELDSTVAATALGNVRVEGTDASLRVLRNHAVAGGVTIYDGGSIQLSDATSFTTTGDMLIGRSWDSTGGTFDLGSNGSGILAATGEHSVLRVQGFSSGETAAFSQLTGSGQVMGFSEIHFTGGASYHPGEGTGPLLLAAENVYVGSARYSSDPVSAIYSPGVLGIGGHLRIRGGGLVELKEGDVLSAERITVARGTLNSGPAVLRSRGAISAAAPEAAADLTVGNRGLLEAEMAVLGRISLESLGGITAIGDLVMGDGQSVDGFHMTGGKLDIGAHHVTLLDYDGAHIRDGYATLNGGKLESSFLDSVGGASVIRLGDLDPNSSSYAGISGSGTIASRLLSVGSSYVHVPDDGSLTLDTSAEIFEQTPLNVVTELYIGKNAQFLHDAGFGSSVVSADWLFLGEGSSYRVVDGSGGSQLALQDGGGISGAGSVQVEVRGSNVNLNPAGSLYLESATLLDSSIQAGQHALTYRYDLSLLRGSLTLDGGSVRTSNLWSTGGGSTMHLTESVVTGHGTIGAEKPIESRGTTFVASGGQLVIEGDLVGNGVLVGDVDVTGSVHGSNTGYPISNLLVLTGDAVVFGQSRATFEAGVDFGNGRRLSAPEGIEIGIDAVVKGVGTIAGSVVNSGRIEPGNSPGEFVIEGDLTLESTSQIAMDLAGTISGVDFDHISVEGDIMYSGELVLTLASPVPAGTTFQIFSVTGNKSGTFSSIRFTEGSDTATFNTQTGTLIVNGQPTDGDSDNNGLPDAWEIEFFGAIGVDPSDDADGDGVSNWDEYVAGTHPQNSQSFFRCEIMRVGADTLVRVQTVEGRNYRLLGSDELDLPLVSWIELDTAQGNGEVAEWQQPGGLGDRFFFCVEVSIPSN